MITNSPLIKQTVGLTNEIPVCKLFTLEEVFDISCERTFKVNKQGAGKERK